MSLRISKEAELRISTSNLFHSLITDRKKEVLKKLCLIIKGVMLFQFLKAFILLLFVIKCNKCGRDLFLSIL